jgi:hypothetical protein
MLKSVTLRVWVLSMVMSIVVTKIAHGRTVSDGMG